MQPLLDTDEAARVLAIKPDTLRKWARTGRIPVIRIGKGKRKSLRFSQTDIDRMIEKGRG